MKRLNPIINVVVALVAIACLAVDNGWVPALGGKLEQVVIVEETGVRSQSTATIILSPLLDPFSRAGILRVVDPDQKGPDIAEVQWAIDASATAKVSPAICFRRASRATVKQLPLTPEATAKLIKAYGG